MTARLWSVASGASLHTLAGHTDLVRSVVFSVDGSRLLTGSWDGTVRTWNAAAGTPVATLTAPVDTFINGLAVTPDGTRVMFTSPRATASPTVTTRFWTVAASGGAETPLAVPRGG